MIIAFYIHWL